MGSIIFNAVVGILRKYEHLWRFYLMEKKCCLATYLYTQTVVCESNQETGTLYSIKVEYVTLPVGSYLFV